MRRWATATAAVAIAGCFETSRGTSAGDASAGDTSTSTGDTSTGDTSTTTGDTSTTTGDTSTGTSDASTSTGDASTGTSDTSTGDASLPTAWVGLWMVDQPYHALYEATFYELRADGGVRVGASDPPDCGAHLEGHCVTGSVARGEARSPSCVFGARWWSPAADRLAFVGVCDDGVARDIVLGLPAGADAARGFTPTVESVGGEVGWAHDNFDWRFVRCPAGAAERPDACQGF